MIHPLARIAGGFGRLYQQMIELERALEAVDTQTLAARLFKLGTPISLCGAAAVAIITLWQSPYLLAVVLAAIAFVKHKLYPLRFELLWYCGVAVLGAYAEALIIAEGGAWSYAKWQYANIPVWLPAIWGLVGISLMTAYSALTEKVS